MSKRKLKLLTTTPPLITVVGSDKGGVGKSFISSLIIDLFDVAGRPPRIIQIDEQERLPSLYPGRVTTVSAAKLDEVRRDPATIVTAFDPLYAGIEATLSDRIPTVIDIGGPQQTLIEEYCALVDLDGDLAEADASVLWLVPATAEPEAMRGAVRTAAAIGRILPSARRAIVLNERDGSFKFYPNSPADRVWRDDLSPLVESLGPVSLPAIASGSWAPFEAAGKRFVDVVAAEVPEIQAWTGCSRPAAKVARGDVAAFLAAVQKAMERYLALSEGGEHVRSNPEL